MQRLIDDANALKVAQGELGDLSIESYSDIVDAIHLVQTEMGITGTTALEASSTIEGSLGMVKTSWENLLTGLADQDADVGQLVTNLIDSLSTAAENLFPVIKTVFSNIGTAISDALATAGPVIKEKVPVMLNGLVDGIANFVPVVIETMGNILSAILDTVTDPAFLASLGMAAIKLITALIQGIASMVASLEKGIANLISSGIEVIGSFVGTVLSKGAELIKWLVQGVVSVASQVPTALKNIISQGVSALSAGVTQFMQVGANLITGLYNGIKSKVDWVIGLIKGMGSSIISAAKSIFGIHSPSKVFNEQIGKQIAVGLGDGIRQNEEYAEKSIEELSDLIVKAADKKLKNWKVYNDMTLQDEMDFWDEVRQQTDDGTQARIDADEKYFTAKKKLQQEDQNTLKALEDAEKNYYDAVEKSLNKIEERSKSILSQFNLFKAFEKGEKVESKDLMENLKTQVSGLEEWQRTLDKLQDKIGGTALFDDLRAQGIDSLAEVEAINNMTASQLEKYVGLYERRTELAEKQAVKEVGPAIESEMDEALNAYRDKVEELGGTFDIAVQDVEEKAKDWGGSIVKKIADGIKDNASLVTQEFAKMFSFGDSMIPSLAGAMTSSSAAVAQPQQTTANITLQLDGKTLARTSYVYNQQENGRRGTSLTK